MPPRWGDQKDIHFECGNCEFGKKSLCVHLDAVFWKRTARGVTHFKTLIEPLLGLQKSVCPGRRVSVVPRE